MPWHGPEHDPPCGSTPCCAPSLVHGVLDWWQDYLSIPSGPHWGEPFVPTREQATYAAKWYRLDGRGRFVHRRAAKREAKGKGKSPEAAALALVEFSGPVVFDGWDADGEPVGRPHPSPWVQVAACSEDQAGNTYSALFEMLRDSPALDEFGIDLGLTRVHRKGGPGRIEAVTASAGSREGQPVTFAVLDETHYWLPNNGGRRLAATIRRNVAKMSGRTVETTNAFLPGEGSVAEETHKAAEKGEAGLLYQATEAPWVEDLSDKRALKKALKIAYGDSTWVDLDRIVAECNDPATDPSDARRFYLNQLVKGAEQAIDPRTWADLSDAGRVVADGEQIAAGFDGSISDDATALVGCTRDGHLFNIEVWQRPPGAPHGWRIPRAEVHDAILRARERWNLGRLYCDPAKWWSEIEEWAETFGEDRKGDPIVVMFDTNQPRRMAPACDRFTTAIAEGSLSHDGASVLSAHVLAMARRKVRVKDEDADGRTRYIFVKSDTRKIDAGIAAVLALEASVTLLEPKSKPRVVSLAAALEAE